MWRREGVGWEGEEGCRSEVGDWGNWCPGDGGDLGVQSTSVPHSLQVQLRHRLGPPLGRQSH